MINSYSAALRRRIGPLALAGVMSFGAAGCAVSPQQEAQIGAQTAAEVNQQLPVVGDAAINQYINQLGNQIARNVERKFNYRFYVVNINQVNAFALPGGFVYINRGVIERADNVSELAGVLAHEIAHVELRHGAENIERAQRANVGLSLAYVLLGRAPSGAEEALINVGGTAVFAKYGREAEDEADATAIPLLMRAGIDPNGLLTFFKELLDERQRSPNALEQWFSTHPLTEDRIAGTRERIRALPASSLRNLTVNTNAFNSFKSRVRQLPQPPAEFR